MKEKPGVDSKLAWQGVVAGVQPHIRLLRSFDQRSHTYLGYVLRITGQLEDRSGTFLIAIGPATQAKYQLRMGDQVQGRSEPVVDARRESAELYKTSHLKLMQRAAETPPPGPPWQGLAPDLEVYRARGHRRLSARTYDRHCAACLWGCRMPVEMIIDQWNPGQKRYRFETFCYGPKSCALYKAGPTRQVPGRKGMSWEEEDWIDAEATAHRRDDE